MDRAKRDRHEDSPVLVPLDVIRFRLIAIAAAANLLIISLAVAHLGLSRFQAEQHAASMAESIAALSETNLLGIIGKIDLGLHAVVDEAEAELSSGAIDQRRLDAFIVREETRIPEILTLRAANAEGQSIYGADLPVVTTRSIVQREYYQYLRDTKTDELVFSDPLIGGITGKWMMLIARRIDRPDGSFGGLSAAGVGLFWLTKDFASFDLGEHSSIELRDHAFAVVDGYPIASDSARSGDSSIGKNLASRVGTGATSGHFTLPRGNGNPVTKFVSYKQVGTFPLFVTVGLARRDYLQTWYRSALAAVAAAFAFLAVSILLALLYYHGAQRSRTAARALASQERKYRTIADYTYDWEFWIDANGAYFYVSPSCERITGYRPSEFYLDPAFFATTILSEDREIYRSHRHLSEPGNDFATLSFRIRRADGKIRWIEHLCRPVFSEEGAWLGTRGTNRDITERREAEERIRALLEEKDLILKEVHHRIKNNMAVVASLLDIQAEAEREGPASQTLRIASNRVKSMAVLYDKLYRTEAGKSASLGEYLFTLLKEVHGSFPGHEHIELSLELEEIELDSEKLSRLGILLNELLTNSMKYAFAGRCGGSIRVRAYRDGARLEMHYEDNGIGLSSARDVSGTGFGMTLIAALAKQLGGVSTMGGEEGFSYALSLEV